MKLTSILFEAYLKCSTKCYLRSTGPVGSGNAYADWVRQQNEAYQKEGIAPLLAAAGDGLAASTPGAENLKTARWRLAVDLPLETETMASRLHAVQRVPSQGPGSPAHFIPIRFVFFNKLTNLSRKELARLQQARHCPQATVPPWQQTDPRSLAVLLVLACALDNQRRIPMTAPAKK